LPGACPITHPNTRMKREVIAAHAGGVSRWSAIALGVSIPVSTALDNVLLAVILAAWAFSGQARKTANLLSRNYALLCPLLLFGLLAVGTLYGESPQREAFAHLSKYADLLFIPVFATLFRDGETRSKALHAFAATVAVVVVLSYMIRLGILPAMPLITGVVESPTVFKLKITHSLLVAFGAFLFAWLGSTTADRRLRLVWYTLSLLAALNVLLLVKGATAYLTLGALVVLWGSQRVGRHGAIGAILVLATMATMLIALPTPFQERVLLIKQEIQDWRADKVSTQPSSTGLRLDAYKNTLGVIAEHPLTGAGTGGFSLAYATQVRGRGIPETSNPHNEYLNIAAQIGISGMAILITMFWLQWRSAQYLDSPMETSLARGLVLTMAIGCMVNSLLLDHTEGLFYAWFSGLLYGGLKYALPEKLHSQR
jgi:O-antigen ligase